MNNSLLKIFLGALNLTLLSGLSYGMAAKLPKPADPNQVVWVKGIQEQKQLDETWCWNAATRMLLSKYRGSKTPSQCEIASRTFNTNCCPENALRPLVCQQGQWPEKAIENFGVSVTTEQGGSFEFVESLIKKGKPVIAIGYIGGSQHAYVVYGFYKGADGNKYLVMYDPYTGTKMTTKRGGGYAWHAIIYPN